MKKLIPALFVAGIMSTVFISCGPSAEEKAAAEQHMKDSIAAVETARADSMMAAQKAMEDSMAMVKMTQDSMAAKATADSLAALKSKPKTKKPAPKAEEPHVGKKKPGAN